MTAHNGGWDYVTEGGQVPGIQHRDNFGTVLNLTIIPVMRCLYPSIDYQYHPFFLSLVYSATPTGAHLDLQVVMWVRGIHPP